jgi:hypothetical protein
MLYDQAQLVLAYLEAALASGSAFYLEVAEDTLRYVMREMTDNEGGFFSAEDADSIPPEDAGSSGAHKSEGAFYLWRDEEVDALLGADAALVKRRFGIEPQGNAPFDPQEEFTGKNLLYVARTIDDLAAEFGVTSDDASGALSRARLQMFRARLERPRPHLDDKVLTAWNGLMIGAFARAARAVGETAGQPYLETARKAAQFFFDRMWNADTKTLRRRFRDGHAEIDAYAEDYAFLIFALLELVQSDPDPKWLAWAVALQDRQDELFWDTAEGGWFSTTGTDASVLLRMKDDYDGAEPGASSISVLNLLALSHLLDDGPDRPFGSRSTQIDRTLMLFGARLEQLGRGVPMMGAALSTYHAGVRQVVIVGDDPGTRALHAATAGRYMPFTFTFVLTGPQQAGLAAVLPLVRAMTPIDGKAAAYVCRDFTCRPPVTDASELEHELGR